MLLGFATLAGAQSWTPPDAGADGADGSAHPGSGALYPARGVNRNLKAALNLSNYGGPVIPSAHVVFIFWGPTFNNVIFPDYNYARTLQIFRNQLGTTAEYNTITQYNGSNGFVALSNLGAGTSDWFDSSVPPANVTDAVAQSEINTYLSSHSFDASAIYEVVLPSSSYSSATFLGATYNTCGGPAPARYCAIHYFYTNGANVVKYSVQPYPSCAFCQVAGWTAEQVQEKLVTHETREAVTDPMLNTWKDPNGDEADDKCSSLPFIGTGGYGYQYEWSNALSGCTMSTPLPLPPSYAGYFDHAGCDTLAGWVADRNKLNTPITVTFYNSGAFLTSVLANLSRPDVGAYLGDNGLHGFAFATPASLLDGSTHAVSARFESSGTVLSPGAISLTCSSTPAAPTNLAAFYDWTTHKFTLTWVDNSYNEQGFVAQFSYSGSAYSDLTPAVAANVTSYVSGANPPIGSYQFRVRAYNGPLYAYSGEVSLLVANPSNGAGYIGCYTDAATRALPAQLGGTTNTIESCKQAAYNAGYKYAGLQYGGYCFAGNTLGYALAPETDCNMVCTANSLQLCGGPWRNSVYDTGYVPTPPATSIAWIQPAESSWGPAGTLTAAGYATHGTGGVTLVWRERSSSGVWGSWNTVAYVAPVSPDTTWSNTISSGNPTNICHWFDAYTLYSGVNSAVFHFTGAPGC
jgi:hypothetical protein